MSILKGKYAILGGSGLVGTSILSMLKDADGVEVVSTYFTRQPKVYADNITHINMDLRIKENCQSIVKDVDYVILTASNILLYSMPEDIIVKGITSNLLINSQVLEACYDRNIKKIVWISSTTAYPERGRPLIEDEIFSDEPIDSYFSIGWMTRFIEKLCIIYSTKLERKMSIAILRPTCIYGENEGFNLETCHVLPSMIKNIIDRNEPIKIYGDGEQKRDFIYVDDVAALSISLLYRENNFDTFNVGTGVYYSVNDIIDIVCDKLEINDLKVSYIESDRPMKKDRRISIEKIKKEINFKPSVDIYEGVTRLIREYKNG